MTATGRCLCGAVSYCAEKVENHVHACHCAMCRRWSGSSMIAAEVGSVVFEGSEHIGRYDSSDWAERGFCTRCGSSLFYRLKSPDTYIMTVGGFDDQAEFELVGEIHVDAKPPGYDFAGEHPRQTGAEFMASLQE